jgi:hypothetical protein
MHSAVQSHAFDQQQHILLMFSMIMMLPMSWGLLDIFA